jgi:DNA-binding NtrC family response regulator
MEIMATVDHPIRDFVKQNPRNNSMSLIDRTHVKLLIVDDEEDFRDAAEVYFRRLGYQVVAARDAHEALEIAKNQQLDVAVVDIHMPGMSGIDLLTRLREEDHDVQVIMLTGGGTIENAVESMKRGARDFLTKPAKLNELDITIQKAYKSGRLEKENRNLRQVLQKTAPPAEIIGQSQAMQAVYRLIEKTAVTDKPVLIQGESGTGKELVARAIHRRSALANQPLIVINCAALPETLLESELFGHEKGAFTGAVASKLGLFELADGGTLFIDEFGELAGPLQAKLLRVLEDGSMRRIGSVKERHVKVRLIAATNRDLADEVRAGRFREDLYYRINVLTIPLPPLRQREGDIDLLIKHFVGPDWKISSHVIQELQHYSWPGNVRQLQNAIERAKILADDDEVLLENLPAEVCGQAKPSVLNVGASQVDLETLNKLHVEQIYNQHGRNKSRTAKALGINRRSLYRLLEKYGIGD